MYIQTNEQKTNTMKCKPESYMISGSMLKQFKQLQSSEQQSKHYLMLSLIFRIL